MVLESTVVCVDNSDYMRNGDFIPTRLQAQQDAVNLICHSKTRANPENNVGLLVMSEVEVLATLSADVGRIQSKLHQVQPKGMISFCTGIRVAHLVLKHRQGRNHKTRIVAFVGSPIEDDEKEIVKIAKKLKKEKVNCDVINFGEEPVNTEKLTAFINTINGKEGTSSHLVTVPPGPLLSEALINSPVVLGEDGSGAGMQAVGFEFGVDPNEDPELALALRVSMEEQRARQEEDAKKAVSASAEEASTTRPPGTGDEALLEQAIAMSMQPEPEQPEQKTPSSADFSSMTEEEQIAYAMQMSLTGSGENTAENTPAPMEVDDGKGRAATSSGAQVKSGEDEDYSEVMNDPAFLQSVLENLPGVDPQSEAIQKAMSSLTQKILKRRPKDITDCPTEPDTLAANLNSSSSEFDALLSLEPVKALAHKSQFRDSHIYYAYTKRDRVIEEVAKMRKNVDQIWEEWYTDIRKIANEVDTDESCSRKTKMQRNCSNVQADTPGEYYKSTVAIPFLDKFMTQMRERFDRENLNIKASMQSVLIFVLKMMERRIKLKYVNPHITCGICKGYLIDATTITECLHTFCKSCLVKFLEENNTCPTCKLVIHQSHPMNYISFDRTMQDIVYKLVPSLQEKEAKKQHEFYKQQGLSCPTTVTAPEDTSEVVKVPQEKEENKDYHRSDEQLNVCLECKGLNLKHLKRKYLRLSSQATIVQLKKFIALKVFNNLPRYTDIDILCNEELLGKDHTLKFVAVTRWRVKDKPLHLQYRQRLDI
ncbi:hypothetical protein ScPMuIL_001451 [Solemya velum]